MSGFSVIGQQLILDHRWQVLLVGPGPISTGLPNFQGVPKPLRYEKGGASPKNGGRPPNGTVCHKKEEPTGSDIEI